MAISVLWAISKDIPESGVKRKDVPLPDRLRISAANIALVIALAICGVYTGNATAGEGAVALPTVHVVTKEIRFHHRRALLVKSIAVGNLEGATLRVSCNRCQRYSTRIRETHPTPATKRFSGVSWIIIVGRDIQIAVSKSGQIGRFLLLGASSHNTLAFKVSGCLTARPVHRVSCPKASPAAPVGNTVPGGNPTVSSKPEVPGSSVGASPGKTEEEPTKDKSTPGSTKQESSPTTPSPEPSPPPPPATHSETPGGPVHTWTNYSNAGGSEGPEIPSNETVQIACKVEGFKVSDGNTWWYRIASSPWNSSYYGSADAFYNDGATSGSLIGTPFVDPSVPNC